MSTQREQFSSKLGFILAAAGSAVGIGNLVGFPVAATKNGGGAFLLIYAAFVLFICLPVMLAEMGLGRRAQRSPYGSYDALGGGTKRWRFAGFLATLTPFMIAIFYMVITVWIFGYLFQSVTGNLATIAADNYFDKFVNDYNFVLYLAAVTVIVNVILVGGVRSGIERASKILMPALFIMLIMLVVFVMTLDNASTGVQFYLVPDFTQIDSTVINGALSQAFFSLSLGMGILITYGSYFRRSDDIVTSGKLVALTDTAVAFIAGLMTLPAIFAIYPDTNPETLSDSSVSMIFSFFPKIFLALQASVGYIGASIAASIFFLLMFVAAITSLVSIIEVPTAAIIEKRNISRKRALFFMGVTVTILTIIAATSFGLIPLFSKFVVYAGMDKSVFDVIYDVFYDTILPLNGLLICLFVRARWKREKLTAELSEGNPNYATSFLEKYVSFAIGTFIPLILALVFINTVLNKFFCGIAYLIMANQVFDQLIDQLKTAHLRAVFLWDGPSSWWQAALAEFTGSLSPSLSLGGEGHVEVTRYRDYLGQSYQQVVLDLSTGMNYDALAALHGTVAGGGCMHVILPASSPSTRRLRATAAGFETLLQLTPVDNIQSKLQTLLKAVAKYPERGRPAKPTEQQRAVITELLEHTNTPNILVADRGRGKSTAAGLAIHQLLQQEAAPNVVVTAPRRQAATTLLEHAGSTSHKLAFVAWDTLLRDNLNYTNQLLVIDEAGALPQHALKRLLAKFQVWIMTTTVDGYEGSGRGFAIRLQQQVTQTMNGRSHTLTEPMRWAANDPAELWLRTALLMNSSMHENQTTDVSTLQLQLCHASSLTERQLTDCFALLMEAHYQSSPNDLRLLLDDPQQQLLLALSQQQCIAVVWLSTEGPLPQSLHQPIVSGQRRPPGNLLPQSLAYHLQIPQVLAHKWLRVVRIVVDENQRQRGIGLRLLHECAAVAEATQCVALGTSFGGTNQLLKFWRAAGFSLVRQSHKLNMASGYAAVTMLKPLQPFTGELESLAVASELAQAERVWRQQSEPAVVPDFISHELVALLQRQLTAFVAGSLNLADIQFSLVLWAKFGGQLPASLQQLLRQPAPLADLAKHAGYNSQAELAKALRAHLQKLL